MTILLLSLLGWVLLSPVLAVLVARMLSGAEQIEQQHARAATIRRAA